MRRLSTRHARKKNYEPNTANRTCRWVSNTDIDYSDFITTLVVVNIRRRIFLVVGVGQYNNLFEKQFLATDLELDCFRRRKQNVLK